MKARMLLCALAATASLTAAAGAQIAQWNFNSNPADGNTATGLNSPSLGSGALATIGGITTTFASGSANGGSSDPAPAADNSGFQTTTYPAQGSGSGTAGLEVFVSTLGFDNIAVSWDQRHSNTSSRFWQFLYTLDGATFTAAGLAGDGIFSGPSGDTWFNSRTVDLSSIAGASNNPAFGFRIVSVFDPASGAAYTASNSSSAYAASGTSRFDMVTVIPAPGALALLGLGSLIGLRRRR